jgi:hypothetical protein
VEADVHGSVLLADEKVSKGVRKLREKEAREGKEIVLQKSVKEVDQEDEQPGGGYDSGRARHDEPDSYPMDDIQSVRLPFPSPPSFARFLPLTFCAFF